MADFNDRFPSAPSLPSQLATGFANGAKAKMAQAGWVFGGMNGPQPPMYTGGPSYPLQAQDLQNSKIAGDARAQAGGYTRTLVGDPSGPPVKYMAPDYNPTAQQQPAQSAAPEWLQRWLQNRAASDLDLQQKQQTNRDAMDGPITGMLNAR